MIPALTPLANPSLPPPLPVFSSAGVFNASHQLVRTLWSASPNDPRNPATAWDGTLDDGTVASTGTYTINLLTSQTTYQWDGVVGNSAVNHPATPLTYIGGSVVMWQMAIADSLDVFWTNTYHEKNSTVYFTTTSDMNHAYDPYKWPHYGEFGAQYGHPDGWGTLTWGFVNAPFYNFVVTDGIVMYIANSTGHGYSSLSYVVGVTASTKQQIMYSSGDANGHIGVYVASDGNGYINSIAAQRAPGNFMFIARSAANQIWVVNKTTGATVGTPTWTSPLVLCANPVAGDLWYADATAVRRLIVSPTGVLTADGITITGVAATAMAISPDGATLLIADNNTQQIKAFNTIDGSIKTAWGNMGTLGLAGGYATNPAVTDNKFMLFTPATGQSSGPGGFICYAPDGSFWFGDNGNYRHLHFSAGNNPTVIERTAYVPTVYSCAVCRGDDTRMFGNFLEWKIDYTQPFDSSWTLVNNWAYGLTSNNFDNFWALRYVGIYQNGRTYAGIYNVSTTLREIWELTANGPRNTGTAISNHSYLGYNLDVYSNDNISQIFRLPFTGFDGSGNPTWAGDPTQDAFSTLGPGWVPYISAALPVPAKFPDWGWSNVYPAAEPLANNTLPMFKYRNISSGLNHYGGVDTGSGAWRFNTHPETNIWGGGIGLNLMYYPEAPFFPCSGSGSPSNYGGSFLYRPGANDVFTSCRCELWGGGQTNMWSHWHQSGLLINRFGQVSPAFAAIPLIYPNYFNGGHQQLPESGSNFWGMPGRAGNVTTGGIAQQGNNYYIFHGEEWVHSGLHRWTVQGLNSINYGSVATINWNSASFVPPTPTPGDMLAGLPLNVQNVPDNSAGWRRTPTADIGTEPPAGSPNLAIMTNSIRSDPRASPDLYFGLSGFTSVMSPTAQLKKIVPRTGTGNWTLTLTASIVGGQTEWYKDTIPANENYKGMWIEVVDNAALRIVSLWPFLMAHTVAGQSGYSLWVNEQPIDDPTHWSDGYSWRLYISGGYHSYPVYDGSQWKLLRPIIITGNVASNNVQVQIGPYSITTSVYDTGASIANPHELQFNVRFRGADVGTPTGCAIDLVGVQFTG
jgi:hypothetical protein